MTPLIVNCNLNHWPLVRRVWLSSNSFCQNQHIVTHFAPVVRPELLLSEKDVKRFPVTSRIVDEVPSWFLLTRRGTWEHMRLWLGGLTVAEACGCPCVLRSRREVQRSLSSPGDLPDQSPRALPVLPDTRRWVSCFVWFMHICIFMYVFFLFHLQ